MILADSIHSLNRNRLDIRRAATFCSIYPVDSAVAEAERQTTVFPDWMLFTKLHQQLAVLKHNFAMHWQFGQVL